MRTALLLLALAAAGAARADWSLDLVRIACIPEARFLRVEHVAVDGGNALSDSVASDRLRAQRMAAWKRAGFHDPARLRFECRMPDARYRIEARQPPASERGMCGGAPRITLSLTREGEPMLREVTFGNDCFEGPTVASVTLFDGLRGWDTRNMTVCLRARGRGDEAEVCRFLSETYSDISKATPITQGALHKLIADGPP